MSEPVCPGCAGARGPVDPAPAGETSWHRPCLELRTAGARYARGLEREPVETFLRRWAADRATTP